MSKVIIISDGKVKDVSNILKGSEIKVVESSLADAITVLRMEGADAAVLYLDRDMSRAESMISEIKLYDDALPVIVVSTSSKLEDAVLLMKCGVLDYFQMPLDAEKFKISVANAVRIYHLTKRVYLLENQMGFCSGFDNIIGHSVKMQEIFQLISTIAKSNATVLILGESGTGKELVAKAIHKYSPRATSPFIDINCGAIPRELLENELFGHEKGSYTGADRRYIGCCERAHKGTLFLDEICEMEPALQVKILRLLQERSFIRVGGHETINVDIRFVAATNRDIGEEVRKGRFREDLFYRLNVVPIVIPPLRDRPEDIPLLAKHFLEKFSSKNEKIFVDFEPEAIECLVNHKWPGNVRELENVIERVVVLHNDSVVKVKHLPQNLQVTAASGKPIVRAQTSFLSDQKIIPLELLEKYAIEAALSKCAGNVTEAATQLKIGQATLYRKIKQYGLKA